MSHQILGTRDCGRRAGRRKRLNTRRKRKEAAEANGLKKLAAAKRAVARLSQKLGVK